MYGYIFSVSVPLYRYKHVLLYFNYDLYVIVFFQFIINSYRDWIRIELWGLDVLKYNFV